MNAHSGQPKPNLRHKRKALSGLEDLLEIVVLKVMAEGVRAGTHSEDWRERIQIVEAETIGAKRSANKWDVVFLQLHNYTHYFN